MLAVPSAFMVPQWPQAASSAAPHAPLAPQPLTHQRAALDNDSFSLASPGRCAALATVLAMLAGGAKRRARERGAASVVPCLAAATDATATKDPVTEAPATETAKKAKPTPKAKAKPVPKAKAKVKKAPPVPLAEQAQEGIFAPLMIAGQATVGEPFVTKARGKGIGLHAKAIGAFCEQFAINNKKKQGFVKTAKVTGHDLGFLIPGGHFGDGLFGPQAMDLWKALKIDKW
mmetsp:Transcript_135005/g.262902  ORF Transcript_135005/g.262902 Transcript_135005/m.262902 type:complete len:231 (-) Transcript_135005:117-809(-)